MGRQGSPGTGHLSFICFHPLPEYCQESAHHRNEVQSRPGSGMEMSPHSWRFMNPFLQSERDQELHKVPPQAGSGRLAGCAGLSRALPSLHASSQESAPPLRRCMGASCHPCSRGFPLPGPAPRPSAVGSASILGWAITHSGGTHRWGNTPRWTQERQPLGQQTQALGPPERGSAGSHCGLRRQLC